MKRGGFIFTLDAVLALMLVVLFVSSIVAIQAQTVNVYTTYSRTQDKYTAESTLMLLRTTPLADLVPADVIATWTEKGILNTTLVSSSMSPLDIAATYWATGPIYNESKLRHDAEIILGYILNNTLKGYDYELLINNYTSPYLRRVGANPEKAQDISPATLLLSGYAYNRTPRGYMARAYLTRVSYIRQNLFGWFRVLAGSYGGYSKEVNTLNITRTIVLPTDAVPLEADGKFVARHDDDDVTLYVNGNKIASRVGQININLENYIQGGMNTISLLYSAGEHSEIGSASGTTLYVKYKSSSVSVEDPGLVRVYQVISQRTGFMYLLEMFVPGNITDINMKFKVQGIHNVRLYYGFGGDLILLDIKHPDPDGVVEFTDADIKKAVNSILCNGADCYSKFKVNLSKMVFDFVVGFDAYFGSDGKWRYEGQDYNISKDNLRILYGYPESYVRIGYKSKVLITQYSIPLSIYFPYGDPRVTYQGSGLQVRYSLPPKATPWYADWWVGYTFWDHSTYQNLYENGKRFYRGPLGRYAIRVAYTKMYPWMMVNGSTNRFEIRMSDGDSVVRDGETRGILKYFINGSVGYGDIFPYLLQGYPVYKGYNLTYWYSLGGQPESATILVGDPPYKSLNVTNLTPVKYAVDDAILRLFNVLNYRNDANPGEWKKAPFDGSKQNPIDLQPTAGLRIETASMGNIPGLFSPIIITLRVWREG
ncbi:MAG: TPM domain-containing protein [Crenarchaeota archaeon]|nr:TPM domain-containing protein [Thermoproteota archaeon]